MVVAHCVKGSSSVSSRSVLEVGVGLLAWRCEGGGGCLEEGGPVLAGSFDGSASESKLLTGSMECPVGIS